MRRTGGWVAWRVAAAASIVALVAGMASTPAHAQVLPLAPIQVADAASFRAAVAAMSGVTAGEPVIEITADFATEAPTPSYEGTQDLTILGNDRVVVGPVRFLVHDTDAALTLDGIQFSTFSAFDDDPGGVLRTTGGFLTVRSSTFNGSEAQRGGAIAYEGDALIEDSTFGDGYGYDAEPNFAREDGGALLHTGPGSTTIRRSSFLGSQARSVGGAIATSGDLTIEDSTFAGTTSVDAGGGAIAMTDVGTLTITNSTITGVSGDNAIASWSPQSRVWLVDTTVADVEGEAVMVPEGQLESASTVVDGPCQVGSTISTWSYETGTTCRFTGPGDVQSGADPQLAPLADNGGPTQTRAITQASPLFDRVPLIECQPVRAVDQRGEPRPGDLGSQCDVGAFELQQSDLVPPGAPEPPLPPSDGGPGPAAGGGGPVSARPSFAG